MRIEEFKLHHVHNNIKNQEVVRMTKSKLVSQSILEKAGVRVQNEEKKISFDVWLAIAMLGKLS